MDITIWINFEYKNDSDLISSKIKFFKMEEFLNIENNSNASNIKTDFKLPTPILAKSLSELLKAAKVLDKNGRAFYGGNF
jgi:hypothetical protein